MWKNYIKNHALDISFPKFCLNCGREGNYFCEDCKSCIEISPNIYCLCEKPKILSKTGKCNLCRQRNLDGLYSALPYQNNLVKKIIHNFKYEPFIKELSKTLSFLMIEHLQMLYSKPDFSSFVFVPTPLHIKRLKWRGFNQSEKIAKEIAGYFKADVLSDVLIKNKGTSPQMELSKEKREKNVKNAFSVKNTEVIRNKKILLLDDVYTTGSTMEECARVLKKTGAKEVFGMTIARG
jgi:ComF family protein